MSIYSPTEKDSCQNSCKICGRYNVA